MAKLPRAVREQGEESDNAIQLAMREAEARKTEQEAGGEPGKPAATVNKESGDSPTALEQSKAGQVNANGTNWQEAADEWRTRFTNYKASTDRTVHDQRVQIDELTAKVEKLTAEKAAAPAKPAESLPPSSVLSDQEREDYSEEFLGVVGKVSSAAVERIIAEQKSTIERLENTVNKLQGSFSQAKKVAEKTKEDSFFDALDKAVPSWESILQKDARFDLYMSKTDPMSGEVRLNLLHKARADNDPARAARFYTAFAAEHGLPTKLSTSVTSTLQVVPDDSGASDGEANQDEKIYTQGEIDKFYLDLATKGHKGMGLTKEQASAEEKRIYVAFQQGRVRG